MHCLILFFSIFVSWMTHLFLTSHDFKDYFPFTEQIFYIITFSGYSLFENYLVQNSLIENFNNLRTLEYRTHQQKNLLEYLLPSHVFIFIFLSFINKLIIPYLYLNFQYYLFFIYFRLEISSLKIKR